MQILEINDVFKLEGGGSLSGLKIAYTKYGELNPSKSNVIWICHALTANSDPMEWWPSFFSGSEGFDFADQYIVCANILGSCYGTTGPLSIDPLTTTPYYHSFPAISIRDMVNAHQLLASHLGIEKIQLLIGSSMGGYQVVEWCIMFPLMIKRICLLATSAKETPWGIAIHTAQRLAIESDSSFKSDGENAGEKGLIAARAFGIITYRSFASFRSMQSEIGNEKTDDFKASSYMIHQGNKLIKRFNAYSYHALTRAMDTHNIARGRKKKIAGILQDIKQRALIIGIKSDILCPISEQQFLAEHIKVSTFIEIDSIYGHDGFLVEGQLISKFLFTWMQEGE